MRNVKFSRRLSVNRMAAWALLFGLAAAGLLQAGEPQVPGQKPLVIIADTFQFIPGSWARYNILDKKTNEKYTLYFSILDRVKKKGKAFSWIEIEIVMQDQPRVVTRVLVEETRQGPGDPDSAIIQVSGYSPFTVPKKFLKPDKNDEQVAQLKPAKIVKKLERKTVGPSGKQVMAWEVEAVTDDGQEVRAVVSEEIPPIAVYEMESSEMLMTVADWGLKAKSLVDGAPVPFWLWLLEQIQKGVDPEKKS